MKKQRSSLAVMEVEDCRARFVTAEGEEVAPEAGAPVGQLLSREGIHLEVMGARMRVERNPPMVERMQLPEKTIMCGFPVRPRKVQMLFAEQVTIDKQCQATFG